MIFSVRTIIFGFLIGAGVLLWIFWPFTDRVHYPTAGSTIVAFGDSLVAGLGADRGEDFVSILSDRIGEPIINLGVAGDTASDGLARVQDVIAFDPKIVIVLFGGNDAIRHVAPERTFSDLEQIILTLRSAGAGVVLVAEPGGLQAVAYEREYERIAKTYGLAYVPNILKGLIGKTEYMTDMVHPNGAGYRIIADRIEPPLRTMLEGER